MPLLLLLSVFAINVTAYDLCRRRIAASIPTIQANLALAFLIHEHL
jgi:hypothetical protein